MIISNKVSVQASAWDVVRRSLMMSEINYKNLSRVINMPHITNFRDLGGCPCAEGKVVKSNQFYRCADLSNIEEEDVKILKEKDVKIIVDLRSRGEKEKSPDKIPYFCDYYHYSGIVTMDEDDSIVGQFSGNMDMKAALMTMVKGNSNFPNPMEYLVECYKTMAEHSDAFKALFELIKKYPDKPIAFHCTAGKDRTGVAAALILLCLGASEETVMEDYLLSNSCRKAENDLVMEAINKYDFGDDALGMIRSMLEVNESFLQAFFNRVKELYGTWDVYFEKALQVTKDDMQMMRERYLI